MKRYLVLFLLIFLSTITKAQDCFQRLQNAFNERGAQVVSDGLQNVYIVYFDVDVSICVEGKALVQEGKISAIYLVHDDNTSELMQSKFYNASYQQPSISNGISELISNADGERFKIVFIDALNPK